MQHTDADFERDLRLTATSVAGGSHCEVTVVTSEEFVVTVVVEDRRHVWSDVKRRQQDLRTCDGRMIGKSAEWAGNGCWIGGSRYDGHGL